MMHAEACLRLPGCIQHSLRALIAETHTCFVKIIAYKFFQNVLNAAPPYAINPAVHAVQTFKLGLQRVDEVGGRHRGWRARAHALTLRENKARRAARRNGS
jgi:hypothetical protein